jgi:hypothetical protein
MQMAAAALFVLEAVSSVVITLIFVNHDSVLRALQAQGTQVPQGTTVDTVVNFTVGITIGAVCFFAVLELLGALGSFLGWRWMFWAALVLFGLGGLTTFTSLPNLLKPETSPIPLGGLLVSELSGILSLAIFVWMLAGVIKFGPWAMRKPGGGR